MPKPSGVVYSAKVEHGRLELAFENPAPLCIVDLGRAEDVVRKVWAHDEAMKLAQLVADYYEGTDAPIGALARSILAKGGGSC